jgi:hypothetical protein
MMNIKSLVLSGYFFLLTTISGNLNLAVTQDGNKNTYHNNENIFIP